MKVILLEDVRNLGKSGDSVTIKPGYGRNYLLPRNMALAATPANLQVFANEKKALDKKQARLRGEAQTAADKITALTLTISRLSGEDGKLFGSVTNGDVAAALKEQGVEVDKRKIEMHEPIKTLGEHAVPLHLHHDIVISLKVVVAAQATDHEAPVADAPSEGSTVLS
jgi:large subunit ribosomal protein L9